LHKIKRTAARTKRLLKIAQLKIATTYNSSGDRKHSQAQFLDVLGVDVGVRPTAEKGYVASAVSAIRSHKRKYPASRIGVVFIISAALWFVNDGQSPFET
jgi:hypothetical protein